MLRVIADACPHTVTDTLLVLLPCAYATPHDFITHGFVTALRARHIAADMMLVELNAAHYTSGQAVEYLQRDVIVPARARGYHNIWIMGISLGGYGAALHCQKYGAYINGIFLIAPFLGHRGRIAEIKKIGSAAWLATHSHTEDKDGQLWMWLHNYSDNKTKQPPLYLGYGLQDKFSSCHHLLAGILPKKYVHTIAGGHEWHTWHQLWEAFLDRCILPVL